MERIGKLLTFNECSIDELRGVFAYDPLTGIITRKVSGRGKAKAGTVSGSVGPDGRRRIRYDGRNYLSSRIAWALTTGRWPARLVDHEDRNRANDAWANLREATRTQNNVNVSRARTTGLPRGAYLQRGRIVSYIRVAGRKRFLGTFETPEQAGAAYDAAARELHGAFAPT